ncbi:YihY/virulence factor BrkB family protein [Nonomuraea sp. SYSU D8015]|uniref:YihY/virulence factor BrkB family protein n=1 Tax=Nonomuraea sp. SYSU D8015 TaxID=2593644 RepID=UPI001CB73FD8|nr:YhjD/YihY/BrkB family envelope integrity protein [Nonomuraea sp. SYSU D8015]
MSSRPVPEMASLSDDRWIARRPWAAIRRYGFWLLLRDSYRRFRCSDGSSHVRSLALLLCLAVVPFLIALTGLAEDLGDRPEGKVVAEAVLAITPGRSDALVRQVLGTSEHKLGEVALLTGLVTGVAVLVTAMGQVERGANRLYGIQHDRPVLARYWNAFVLTWAAGVPAISGFLVPVVAEPVGAALARTYPWGGLADTVLRVVRWPAGVALAMVAIVVLFKAAPRRCQPSLRWLVPGLMLATMVWLAVSVLLGWYVTLSEIFGDIYGPLTGIIALLLWGELTAGALFFGVSCAAQLEAWQSGSPEPCASEQWDRNASH